MTKTETLMVMPRVLAGRGQWGQGGVQYLGACTGPGPRHNAQQNDYPHFEQQWDTRDEEWFTSWVKYSWILPWSLLLPETILMSVNPFGCLRLCWCAMTSVVCITTSTDQRIFCSGLDDCRLITENERHWRLLSQQISHSIWTPQKEIVQEWRHWRGFLKFLIQMQKCNLSQLMLSGSGNRGINFFLRGWPLGITMLQWVCR